MSKGKVIGIDLGTSNSVMSFTTVNTEILQNSENEDLTKSCVAYFSNEIVVGRYAINNLKKDPKSTVLSVKRLMGGAIDDDMVKDMIKNPYYQYEIGKYKKGTSDAVAITIGSNQYTPQQVSSEILKKLKNDAELKLGGEVSHAVITVPAYFTEKQKTATKQAAKLAGLKVSKLLAEPTAAAIAYGVDELGKDESKTILIYDFGGGTFDLSVLSIVGNNFQEEGTGGDRWLGGDDIDKALTKLIVTKIEEEYDLEDLNKIIDKLPVKNKNKFNGILREEVERTKIQLSSTKSVNIVIDGILVDDDGDDIDIDVKVTRDEFEKSIKIIGDRTISLIEELLQKMSYDEDMIEEILMVGGTSSIPYLQQLLKDRFSKEKIKVGKKPMLAIAEGAAKLAKSIGYGEDEDIEIDNPEESDRIELFTTTNHNYFIELQDRDGQVYYDKIIEDGTPTPFEEVRDYKTVYGNQQMMHLKILADVEGGAMELQTQGYLTLDKSDLPSGSKVKFNFSLSGDETFTISANSEDSKDSSKTITLSRGEEDAKAFSVLNETIKVALSGEYSASKREQFMKETHKLINKINSKGEISANDKFWEEAISDVNRAKRELESPEAVDENDNDNIIKVIAQILVGNYYRYIDVNTLNVAKQNISTIEANNDAFAVQNSQSQLTEFNDGHGLFLDHFLLKIGADNLRNGNPREARNVELIFTESTDAFNRNDWESARTLINDGHQILNNNNVTSSPRPGGTTIGS